MLGFLCGLAACATSPDLGAVVEYQWVTGVLLGREAGEPRDVVVRWQQPVRYLVVDAPPAARAAIDAAFGQLAETLADVHALLIDHVAADDSRIGAEGFATVFPRAPAKAGELVERFGLVVGDAADGWFRVDWNAYHELTRAIVLIDPELEPAWLAHTALEELYQVLGAINDSAVLPDSVLLEGGGVAGARRELADRDRQLLRLLYGDLRPGMLAGDIAAAMQRKWRFGQ